jgi:hypothetical protein
MSARFARKLSASKGVCLPRRFCSASTAVHNWSSSTSVSRLTAAGRLFGRTCRRDEIAFADGGTGADGEDSSRVAGTENRSGVVVRSALEPMR